MIPGTESRFGAHCPLCKHFFILCIVVEFFFIDLDQLSEMITSTSDWMNGQSQGLLDLKLPRSDYVIVLPDSRLECFPQQTLAYSMVCSATVTLFESENEWKKRASSNSTFLQLSNFAVMSYGHFPTRNGLELRVYTIWLLERAKRFFQKCQNNLETSDNFRPFLVGK